MAEVAADIRESLLALAVGRGPDPSRRTGGPALQVEGTARAARHPICDAVTVGAGDEISGPSVAPVLEAWPLVGYTEIAQRAGVLKPAVANWARRHESFPPPVVRLHTGPVWWWPAVEAWLISTDRQTDANWSVERVTRDKGRWALRTAAGLKLRRLEEDVARD